MMVTHRPWHTVGGLVQLAHCYDDHDRLVAALRVIEQHPNPAHLASSAPRLTRDASGARSEGDVERLQVDGHCRAHWLRRRGRHRPGCACRAEGASRLHTLVRDAAHPLLASSNEAAYSRMRQALSACLSTSRIRLHPSPPYSLPSAPASCVGQTLRRFHKYTICKRVGPHTTLALALAVDATQHGSVQASLLRPGAPAHSLLGKPSGIRNPPPPAARVWSYSRFYPSGLECGWPSSSRMAKH
jgi:hypothetical protein